MAEEDRIQWDRRHAAGTERRGPASLLRYALDSAAWEWKRGRALDVAAGQGRNAIFLAERGFAVEAIDISGVALAEAQKRAAERHLTIAFRQADIEQVDLPEARYDLLVNINFLQRALVPELKRALKIGGRVIFETYLIDQQAIGHPKNPAYLLQRGELLGLFSDFRVFYYREGKITESGKDAFRAGLFGEKIR